MKIISPHDKDSVLVVSPLLPPLIEDIEENIFINSDDELTTEKLQQTLNVLYIHNPMPIKDLLDLEEEKAEIHQQFNDDNFLDILRNALQIVDKRIDDSEVTMKSLCKL
ncbi:3363_t:CDS:2 [Scutellospora calospora]|uniref:3363_t:CDS:1 n=1 Tax=Scutellospora calospora TaxID=85575 RepID=A0ACA9LUT7_9GLOM|nr:3363_t:CDS:2 [Scutellospora calospora]